MIELPRVTTQVRYPSRQDLWPAEIWAEMQAIQNEPCGCAKVSRGLQACALHPPEDPMEGAE